MYRQQWRQNWVIVCVALFVLMVVSPMRSAMAQALLTVTDASSGASMTFEEETLRRLGVAEISTSTPWTDGVTTFEGVPLQNVIDAVGASGTTIRAFALNDYSASLPFSDASRYTPLIAWSMNGNPLSRRDKGPLWIVYPRDDHEELMSSDTYSRWVWQLKRLVVE